MAPPAFRARLHATYRRLQTLSPAQTNQLNASTDSRCAVVSGEDGSAHLNSLVACSPRPDAHVVILASGKRGAAYRVPHFERCAIRAVERVYAAPRKCARTA